MRSNDVLTPGQMSICNDLRAQFERKLNTAWSDFNSLCEAVGISPGRSQSTAIAVMITATTRWIATQTTASLDEIGRHLANTIKRHRQEAEECQPQPPA